MHYYEKISCHPIKNVETVHLFLVIHVSVHNHEKIDLNRLGILLSVINFFFTKMIDISVWFNCLLGLLNHNVLSNTTMQELSTQLHI